MKRFWASAERAQVHYCWQRSKYLQSRLQPHQRPLLLNLDETSICLARPKTKGLISPGGATSKIGKERSLARLCFTYVAVICDDSRVQPYLPQFLLGNGRWMTKKTLSTCAVAANLRVKIAKSAWNSKTSMLWMLHEIKTSLADFDVQPILHLDCCPVHIQKAVVQEAQRLQLPLVPVPAGLTWLLQPLDVSFFSAMKQQYRQQYNRNLAEGGMTPEAFLRIMSHIATKFTCRRSWKSSFQQLGFLPGGTLTSELRKYFPAGQPDIVCKDVSDLELQALLPQNHKVFASWWRSKRLRLK